MADVTTGAGGFPPSNCRMTVVCDQGCSDEELPWSSWSGQM